MCVGIRCNIFGKEHTVYTTSTDIIKKLVPSAYESQRREEDEEIYFETLDMYK